MSELTLSQKRARTAAIAFCVGLNACVTSALATVLPVMLTTDLSASYVAASVFMVTGTLASTVAIYGLGRITDRVHLRFPVAIASALCGLAGALALTQASGYWSFLLVFSTLLAVAGSLFPQLLALAYIHQPGFAAFARAIASAGWVIGPPLGGILLSTHSAAALFHTVAAIYAALTLALLGMAWGFSRPATGAGSAASPQAVRPPADGASDRLVITVLAAIHFLMAVCALGIPWRIIEIGGTEFHVGLAFAIAAAIEIPIIAGAAFIRKHVGYAAIVYSASGLLTVYFLAMALFNSILGILMVSVVNGVVTGAMMGLSLIILHERMPSRPGHASALYSNMLRLSYVAALLWAGAIAQWLSVAAIFWAAAALAFATSLTLALRQPLGPMSRGGAALAGPEDARSN